MLRVTTLYAGSAAVTAKYYTKYLTQAPGEQPGEWAGAQAAALGLAGEVSTDALELLLSGRDPIAGTTLGHPFVDRTRSNAEGIMGHYVGECGWNSPQIDDTYGVNMIYL